VAGLYQNPKAAIIPQTYAADRPTIRACLPLPLLAVLAKAVAEYKDNSAVDALLPNLPGSGTICERRDGESELTNPGTDLAADSVRCAAGCFACAMRKPKK
jgi:hypothetical protein